MMMSGLAMSCDVRVVIEPGFVIDVVVTGISTSSERWKTQDE